MFQVGQRMVLRHTSAEAHMIFQRHTDVVVVVVVLVVVVVVVVVIVVSSSSS